MGKDNDKRPQLLVSTSTSPSEIAQHGHRRKPIAAIGLLLAACLLGSQLITSIRSGMAMSSGAAQHTASEVAKPTPSGKFVWLSDFHMDPFYGTSKAKIHKVGASCREAGAPRYGQFGCGSPLALVEGMLSEASALSPPDFILYSGDYQRHDVQEATPDLWQTFAGIINEIRATMETHFPGTAVFMVPSVIMGNNDFIPDYMVNVTGNKPYSEDAGLKPNPYLRKVADLWRGHLSQSEYNSFSYGGYLSREVVPGLHCLVLNTIVYKAWGDIEGDPFGQFQWLRLQLLDIRSRNGRAYVHAHIPPVWDSWGPSPMMKDVFISQFLQLFYEFDDVISAHLFGHLHDNELRAIPGLPADSAPLVIHASTAPCYDNNPFLTEVTYDLNSKRITDFAAHMVDLRLSAASDELQWTLLFDSVLDFFNMTSVSNGAVTALARQMLSDDKVWHRYRDQWFKGVPQGECNSNCRQSFACLLTDGFNGTTLDSCSSTRAEVVEDASADQLHRNIETS